MNKRPILVETGAAYAETGLVHRALIPDSPRPHPTIVMLHGRLGTEDVMWIFQKTLPADWLVIAPRAIVEEEANSYSWHPRPPNVWPTLDQFADAVTAVTHFIDALPDVYYADPQQIYLMGFSQGAATAYATAMQQPGRFRGIAGLVGFMPTQAEYVINQSPLLNLPVFMAVGTRDDKIPLNIAHQCAEHLRAAGAYLEYREYDTGHKLNGDGMRKLKSWWQEREED